MANEQFYTLVTNKGLQLLAAASSGGAAIQLTHMAVGDGGGAYYNPAGTETGLKHENCRVALNSLIQDKTNANWFIAEAVLPDDVGGFMIREVGVFDKAGNLFAIGNVPETYKPTLKMGTDKQLYIRCIFQVSNADSVTLKIDPSIVLATRAYVDDAVSGKVSKTGDAMTGVLRLNHYDGSYLFINTTGNSGENAFKPLVNMFVNNSGAVNSSGIEYIYGGAPNAQWSLLKTRTAKTTDDSEQSLINNSVGLFSNCVCYDDGDIHVATTHNATQTNRWMAGLCLDTIGGVHAFQAKYRDAGKTLPLINGEAVEPAAWEPFVASQPSHIATKQYADSILSKNNIWTGNNTHTNPIILDRTKEGWLAFAVGTNSGEAIDKPFINMFRNNSPVLSPTAVEYLYGGCPANTFSFLKTRLPADPNNKYYPIDNAYGLFINCVALDDGELHARYGWSGTTRAAGLVLDSMSGGGVGALQTSLGTGDIVARPEQYCPNAILPRENWEPFIATQPQHLVTKQYLDAHGVSYFIDTNGKSQRNYALPPQTGSTRENSISSTGTENTIIGGASNTIANGSQNTIIGSYDCEIHENFHEGSYSDVIIGSAFSGIWDITGQTVPVRHAMLLNSRGALNPEPGTIAGGINASVTSGKNVTSMANRKFSINCITGDIAHLGNIKSGPSSIDYTEYFENKEKGILPLGSIVALDGRFVRLATGDDEVVGVVSATGCVAAGDSNFCWAKRYLTGEFGERLYHDIPDPAWEAKIPDPNWAAQVPANTVTPKIINPLYIDGEDNTDIPQFIDNPDTSLVDNPAECPLIDNPVPQGTITAPVENPEFDITQKNIPRSERPEEWSCVGLLGQVHVRADESIAVGDWVKPVRGIGTKSETKTNLRCMEIRQAYDKDKGYAVAFCLLK